MTSDICSEISSSETCLTYFGQSVYFRHSLIYISVESVYEQLGNQPFDKASLTLGLSASKGLAAITIEWQSQLASTCSGHRLELRSLLHNAAQK